MARHLQPAWLTAILSSLLLVPFSADAQSRRRPPANYLGGHQPDQVEGAQILEDMRGIGLGGAYYQDFELILLPRKGAESRRQGRWFGDRNDQGPITRVELRTVDAANPDVLLVQNGPEAAVWRLSGATGAVRVAGADIFQPLAGTTLSAADLQIPFMYWKDFVYEGREPFRERPVFVFLLFPPGDEAASYPGIGGARVFIDTQYHVPTKAQWVDEGGRALKTISVLDLKKVDEQWIVKSFEVRDERTRDKTRFLVTAVALDVAIPDRLLSSDGPPGPAVLEIPPGKLRTLR
jgi:hypothetical protein